MSVKRLAAKPRRLFQTLFVRWLVKRVTGQRLPMQHAGALRGSQQHGLTRPTV